MRKIIASLSLVLMLSVASSIFAQGGSEVEFKGEDDPEKLKTLLTFMSGIYWGGGGATTISVGIVPDDLSVDLPMPDEFIAVGAVQSNNANWQSEQVFIELENTTTSDARNFFSEALTEAGWEAGDIRPSGGFQPQPFSSLQLCNMDSKPPVSLDISFFEEDGKISTVFNVIQGYCITSNQPLVDDPYLLFPSLVAPEGVEQVAYGGGGGGGGGFGNRSASTSTTLISELPLDAIIESYNVQLEAAGWSQVSNEAISALAASSWTFVSEAETNWDGIFTIVADPTTPNHYLANLLIQEETLE